MGENVRPQNLTHTHTHMHRIRIKYICKQQGEEHFLYVVIYNAVGYVRTVANLISFFFHWKNSKRNRK